MAGKNKPQLVSFTGPENATVDFEVYDSRGKMVFAGKTPTQAMLKASSFGGVPERYYVKSGGIVEVFEADFFNVITMVKDYLFPLPVFGIFTSYSVDMTLGSFHGLQGEQELGNVHMNTLTRAAAFVTGGNK
jgi:hypothetical protein